MARILLGWELGFGLGHVANLLPVAQALAQQGHEPMLVLRDIVGSWPLVKDCGFSILPSPVFFQRFQSPTGGARSYADMLAAHGFDDVEALLPMLKGWRQLLDVVRPQLVVAEHAPTLCLAAHGVVPVVNLGTGFTVPHQENGQFPALSPANEALVPWGRVQSTLQSVLRTLGQNPPVPLVQAVLGDVGLPIVVQALDPYHHSATARAVGPLRSLGPVVPLPQEAACLVYLPADHPHLEDLLSGLIDLPMTGIVYVRDATPRVLEWLRETPFEIATTPIDLNAMWPQISVVLHHGGAGIAQQCLAAGRPQVIAPIYREQQLNCQALQELGIAVCLGSFLPAKQSGLALQSLAQSARVGKLAQQAAHDVRRQYPQGSLPHVVQACLKAMQTGPARAPAVAASAQPQVQDITVLFGADGAYIPVLEVALCSLLRSNQRHRLTVHLALSQADAPALERLHRLAAQFECKLVIHHIGPGMLPELPTSAQFSQASYYRLLMPQLLGAKVERLLYLDCDLLVTADLEGLWRTDMAGAIVAAVPDPDGDRLNRNALGLRANHRYFNSGVMLIDTLAWRRESVSQQCLAFLRNHPGRNIYCFDQNALNVCLDSRVTYLGLEHNFTPYLRGAKELPQFDALHNSAMPPSIVHFAGTYKPWGQSPRQDVWTDLFHAQVAFLKNVLKETAQPQDIHRGSASSTHATPPNNAAPKSTAITAATTTAIPLRFCLITAGSSGSTSLMEALQKHADIAVPNKDFHCPSNALLHAASMPKALAYYETHVGELLHTPKQLVDAFFASHPHGYAGFKSFPHHHADLKQLSATPEIQMITLLRLDFACAVASFIMGKLAFDQVMRKGGPQTMRWYFEPALYADSVKKAIRVMVNDYRVVLDTPQAISVSYEQLCQPDYCHPAMRDWFHRSIRIDQPQPPTHAGDYIENWKEFSAFVKAQVTQLDPNLQRDIEAYSARCGYPG